MANMNNRLKRSIVGRLTGHNCRNIKDSVTPSCDKVTSNATIAAVPCIRVSVASGTSMRGIVGRTGISTIVRYTT